MGKRGAVPHGNKQCRQGWAVRLKSRSGETILDHTPPATHTRSGTEGTDIRGEASLGLGACTRNEASNSGAFLS